MCRAVKPFTNTCGIDKRRQTRPTVLQHPDYYWPSIHMFISIYMLPRIPLWHGVATKVRSEDKLVPSYLILFPRSRCSHSSQPGDNRAVAADVI